LLKAILVDNLTLRQQKLLSMVLHKTCFDFELVGSSFADNLLVEVEGETQDQILVILQSHVLTTWAILDLRCIWTHLDQQEQRWHLSEQFLRQHETKAAWTLLSLLEP